MKRHMIPYCCENNPDWSSVPVISIDSSFYETADRTKAWGQLCWNPDWIKVHLYAAETNVLCRYQGNCDPVWKDSCLELFFCPVYDNLEYFNFECNLNGSMFWGVGSGRSDRIRLIPEHIQSLFQVTTVRTDTGWEVYYTIPTKVIKRFFSTYNPQRGTVLRGNLYKCAGDKKPPHYLMWSPITNGIRDFHQPEFFGELLLG